MKIVGYIAASIDGYIADQDEKLDWLHEFGDIDYGDYAYEKFIKKIGIVVMGSTTYHWIRNEVSDWPYADKQSIIVTSKSLTDLPPNVSAWTEGVDALLKDLSKHDSKDIWICGGGKLQSAIIERNAMDHLQIFVMPIVLGGGTRLWPGAQMQTRLELDNVQHIQNNVVRVAYKRRRNSV